MLHAQGSAEGADQAIGWVSGILDVISSRRGPHQVSLSDDATRRAVQCPFPEGMFDAMRALLGTASVRWAG